MTGKKRCPYGHVITRRPGSIARNAEHDYYCVSCKTAGRDPRYDSKDVTVVKGRGESTKFGYVWSPSHDEAREGRHGD